MSYKKLSRPRGKDHTIAKYFISLILIFFLSDQAAGALWRLDAATFPLVSDYPEGIAKEDAQKIVALYKTYYEAFLSDDYHAMADQIDFSSPCNRLSSRLGAVEKFAFIKDHILANHSHTKVTAVRFFDSDYAHEYGLWVHREEISLEGKRLWRGLAMYDFHMVDGVWKIKCVMNVPELPLPSWLVVK